MKRTWQDLVEFLIGAWLVASPFLLGFFGVGSAAGTAILLGSIVAGIAIVGISAPGYWEEWSNLLTGFVLVVSPWLFGYATSMVATVNNVGCGLFLALLAILAMLREQHIHHHPDISTQH